MSMFIWDQIELTDTQKVHLSHCKRDKSRERESCKAEVKNDSEKIVYLEQNERSCFPLLRLYVSFKLKTMCQSSKNWKRCSSTNTNRHLLLEC